jgi:hypothetical protein
MECVATADDKAHSRVGDGLREASDGWSTPRLRLAATGSSLNELDQSVRLFRNRAAPFLLSVVGAAFRTKSAMIVRRLRRGTSKDPKE